jgi:hypothetical protein
MWRALQDSEPGVYSDVTRQRKSYAAKAVLVVAQR